MEKIRDIIDEIERVAPRSLQEDFDNSGIQIGNADQKATGALVCLDVTEAVVDEAIEAGMNLIISHHPLIFKPLKSITGKNYIERCLIKACKHNITIYSAHTNLDNTIGGVNYKLAELFGLEDVRILAPQKQKLLKLVTFVPNEFSEKIRETLFNSGAGYIGNYDSCSFNANGIGTYMANENCEPFRGEKNKLHYENETRIESIFPSYLEDKIINALISEHPYEEPVFDIYPLANAWQQAGSGIIGHLPDWEDELIFLQKIKDVLNSDIIKHSALTGRKLNKVAICGGSGSFLIKDAISAGADIFITGEAKYNDFYDVEDKLLLTVIGHYETEICTKDILFNIISKKFPTFAVQKSLSNINPIKYL